MPYSLLEMGDFVQQDAAKLLAALGADPAAVVAAAAAAKAKAAPKTPEAAAPAEVQRAHVPRGSDDDDVVVGARDEGKIHRVDPKFAS
jgi:hypothetical protein